MCEFGLEGVTIGISKKSSNKDKELKGTLFYLVFILECFSTYFQKNYTILRLEDIFRLKQSFSNILSLVEVNQAILAWSFICLFIYSSM